MRWVQGRHGTALYPGPFCTDMIDGYVVAQSERRSLAMWKKKKVPPVTLEGEVTAVPNAKKKRMKRDSLVVTKKEIKKSWKKEGKCT